MSANSAIYTDVPLSGASHARVYVTPAIVEASKKDQNFEAYAGYETASVVVNVPDARGMQVPLVGSSVTTVYEVYFKCDDGRRLRHGFSSNPEFIPGYRAQIAEIGVAGDTARQTLAIRNVESGRIFRWPYAPEKGVEVYKSQQWPRRSYAAMWITGFLMLFWNFLFMILPFFLAALVVFRNRRLRQYNRRLNEQLQKEAEDIFQRLR